MAGGILVVFFWIAVIIFAFRYFATRKPAAVNRFGLGKPDYEIWSHGGYVGLHLASSQIAIIGQIGDSARKESKVFPLSKVQRTRWSINLLYIEIADLDTPVFRIMMNNPSLWAGRIAQAETAARSH